VDAVSVDGIPHLTLYWFAPQSSVFVPGVTTEIVGWKALLLVIPDWRGPMKSFGTARVSPGWSGPTKSAGYSILPIIASVSVVGLASMVSPLRSETVGAPLRRAWDAATEWTGIRLCVSGAVVCRSLAHAAQGRWSPAGAVLMASGAAVCIAWSAKQPPCSSESSTAPASLCGSLWSGGNIGILLKSQETPGGASRAVLLSRLASCWWTPPGSFPARLVVCCAGGRSVAWLPMLRWTIRGDWNSPPWNVRAGSIKRQVPTELAATFGCGLATRWANISCTLRHRRRNNYTMRPPRTSLSPPRRGWNQLPPYSGSTLTRRIGGSIGIQAPPDNRGYDLTDDSAIWGSSRLAPARPRSIASVATRTRREIAAGDGGPETPRFCFSWSRRRAWPPHTLSPAVDVAPRASTGPPPHVQFLISGMSSP